MNRVASDMNTWRNREERFEKLFPGTLHSNRPFLEEKLQYLHSVQSRYANNANDEERFTLLILKQERDKLELKIYPSLLIRFMRAILRGYLQQKITSQHLQKWEGNKQSLVNSLVKSGFGNIIPQLEQKLDQRQETFSIPLSYYVNPVERLDFKLDFKADSNGNYRLDSYHAALKQEGKEAIRQYQFSNEQHGNISACQAYNLLAGRAVYSENKSINEQTQSAWKQFDFNDRDASGNYRVKEFHADYRYDLDNELQKLPFKEIDTYSNEEIKQNLRDGNKSEVMLIKDDVMQKFYIEANPHTRSVNLYDTALKKVNVHSLGTPKETQSESQKRTVNKKVIQMPEVKQRRVLSQRLK